MKLRREQIIDNQKGNKGEDKDKMNEILNELQRIKESPLKKFKDTAASNLYNSVANKRRKVAVISYSKEAARRKVKVSSSHRDE